MQYFSLNQVQVVKYFRTARERYNILLKRREGWPRPWSDDPIFQEWFFCNVFREDDKVTMWIKERIREINRKDSGVLWQMVAARLFNKISTLEKLVNEGLFSSADAWNRDKAEELLDDVHPLCGAGYMVHTPYGMDKLRGVLKLIDDAIGYNDEIVKHIFPGKTTLKDVWEMMLPQDCFGPFMAYEVVTDLRHTYLLENAPDIMAWASPGPGACLGLSRLVGDSVSYGSMVHRAGAVHSMQEIVKYSQSTEYWPDHWPRWEMRTVEHWLCEHAKWCKVRYESKRMKRKYDGRPTSGA